jgi:arylsulfatase A-like enzyme
MEQKAHRTAWKWAAVGCVLATAAVMATAAVGQEVLPRPEPPFRGKIGRTIKDSKPDFPKEGRAPQGAPNILLIMTDDVGFSAASTFGGPIPTPALDRLAAHGLRFTQFNTCALCSPTRAALLTGRNHHTCATGLVMETGTGYPGYNTLMPKSCGSIGEVLRQSGYNTSWYGKNHNVPDWQGSQAGPFDLWPTGLGFEYFYGFIGGETDQWHPALVENTRPVLSPPYYQDATYILDRDLADHAIAWMREQHTLAPDKPFFAYYVPGATHAPHHAPKEWIARFKGQFDQGWDKLRQETIERQKKLGLIPAGTRLTPRPESIPAWDTLDADHKRLYARMMEVYAAALAHFDYHISRVIDAVEQMGELDNTLIIYIQGDNGASSEGTLQGLLNEMAFWNGIPEDFHEVLRRMDDLGGPLTYNHFPVGWAHALDTPFQWVKQIASHFGGTRNGMVISWPVRIQDQGGIRSQFHHVIDIVPTLMEAAGLKFPARLNGVKQKPLEGVSMLYTFDHPEAPSRHRTQYFEIIGNRGMYHDGWMASTTPLALNWVPGPEPDPGGFTWELYQLTQDFSQADNLAARNPDKLKQLQALFDREARKYNVYPIQTSMQARFDTAIRPSLTRGRREFTYSPGMVRIPEGAAPDIKNKSFRLTAEVEIPEGGAQGMLVTQGGRFSGYGLYLLDGRPVFLYNLAGVARYQVAGRDQLPAGKHTIVLDFKYDGGGIGKGGLATLTVDGRKAGEGCIERTLPFRISLDETLDIGEDTGTPVCEDYVKQMPFKFTGTLKQVVINLGQEKLSSKDMSAVEEARNLCEAARQ